MMNGLRREKAPNSSGFVIKAGKWVDANRPTHDPGGLFDNGFEAGVERFYILGSGFVHGYKWAADYVKDLPFTGMAVHRRWAAANVPLAKRLLAATDKSIAWLTNASHRDEAIDLLVKVARSSREDADASYDYLRRIEYFEPSSKVSRTKLRNLIEVEKRDTGVGAQHIVARNGQGAGVQIADEQRSQ